MAAVALAVTVLAVGVSGSAAAAVDDGTNASFEYEGDRLTLPASSDARIEAGTDLPAGEVVTVRLRSTGQSPFLRSPQATVGRDGRVAAPVDLSRVEPGTTFDAALLSNGTELASTSGVVGACERGCEPTPTPESEGGEPTGSGEWLEQAVVMVTAGDNARIPVAVPDGGPVTLRVTRGDYRLAATARDTDGDGRLTFRIDTGAAGTDARTVFVGEGDTLAAREERAPSGGLDPASYDVNVTDGTIETGREVDVGTLALRACTTCPEPDGSTPDDAEAATPNWPDDDSLLAVPVVTVQAGETTRLPLNVADAATVSIGSEEQGYRLVATVRDADGDGRVALLFYPRNAGTAAPTVAVGGADSVSVATETDLSGPLPTATYDIAVRAGTAATGEPDDIGALDVLGLGGANATATPNGSTVPGAGAPGTQGFAGGLGAIALGGVLAVVGIAVILGSGRS